MQAWAGGTHAFAVASGGICSRTFDNSVRSRRPRVRDCIDGQKKKIQAAIFESAGCGEINSTCLRHINCLSFPLNSLETLRKREGWCRSLKRFPPTSKHTHSHRHTNGESGIGKNDTPLSCLLLSFAVFAVLATRERAHIQLVPMRPGVCLIDHTSFG